VEELRLQIQQAAMVQILYLIQLRQLVAAVAVEVKGQMVQMDALVDRVVAVAVKMPLLEVVVLVQVGKVITAAQITLHLTTVQAAAAVLVQ
jgi:hypothetical protein